MPIRRKALPASATSQLQTGQNQLHTTSHTRLEKAPEPQPSFQLDPQGSVIVLNQKGASVASPPRYAKDVYDTKYDPSNGLQRQLHDVKLSDDATRNHADQKIIYSSRGTSGAITPTISNSVNAGYPNDESRFGDIPFTADPEAEEAFNEQDAVPDAKQKNPRFTAALQDASIFLGGLIKHPTESNKHFTILRHGHGLVYYKGPTTNIAITVFSDAPLPSDRRYWLQMKGWTGNTGMRAKALLRTNASWINVTPARQAQAEDVATMDERVWQRDIKKFHSKAPKQLKFHMTRETAVLRVPFEAVDGYFRVVMTHVDNRSPLCSSPVFRVASTSMSAGSIKGASLGTLPLELGINILQFAAKQTATNAIAPLAGTAKQQVVGMLPSAVQSYGQTAYSVSGVEGDVENLNESYNTIRAEKVEQSQFDKEQYTPITRPDIAGDINGPVAPYPIRIRSQIARGTGQGHRDIGMPTANLRDVPDEKVLNLSGLYFGWAHVQPNDPAQVDLHSDWRHAIITVSNYHDQGSSVAAKKGVRVYIIHDYTGETFFDSKISIVIMGYLRPTIPFANKEAVFSEIVRDIEITRNSLARESWGPEQAIQRIKTAKSDRSFTDRYVDTRSAVQRRVDSVPIHKLGIRNESSGLNHRGLYGNGGIYVVRDRR